MGVINTRQAFGSCRNEAACVCGVRGMKTSGNKQVQSTDNQKRYKKRTTRTVAAWIFTSSLYFTNITRNETLVAHGKYGGTR